MRRIAIFITISLVVVACSNDDGPALAERRWFNGVDLSFQLEIEDEGYQYKNQDGEVVDVSTLFKSKGFNQVRLRIWNNPDNPAYNMWNILSYADRLNDMGYSILLDFHYSDTWADPGKQEIPALWSGYSYSELGYVIYDYTKQVLLAFKSRGIDISIVQVGNETNGGFLWDIGNVYGNQSDAWDRYRSLTSAAISAVREVSSESLVMLHYAGLEGADAYYRQLESVDYDVIGLSFYSIWHGDGWGNIQSTMNSLVANHDKDLMIVETAYPWTLGWNDFTNNLWGLDEQLLDGYPATPAGQAQFMQNLIEKIESIPDNRGIGFSYWAPDWVAFKGSEATNASAWENATMFDFNGVALPVIEAAKQH